MTHMNQLEHNMRAQVQTRIREEIVHLSQLYRGEVRELRAEMKILTAKVNNLQNTLEERDTATVDGLTEQVAAFSSQFGSVTDRQLDFDGRIRALESRLFDQGLPWELGDPMGTDEPPLGLGAAPAITPGV